MNIFTSYADNKNPNSKSAELRKKRFSLFIQMLGIDKHTRILDVGGTEAVWLNSGLEENVTLLNISHPSKTHNKFTYVVGDACNMNMFSNNQFDVVFSNSVIEHVGDLKRQTMFASEVQRVCKKYWVQTPNKHFPIEPHFVFPFFQYLPKFLQYKIGLNWNYSHFKMSKNTNESILSELERLRLLNQKEMKKLFDNGSILKEKYLGMTKSIIAYKN